MRADPCCCGFVLHRAELLLTSTGLTGHSAPAQASVVLCFLTATGFSSPISNGVVASSSPSPTPCAAGTTRYPQGLGGDFMVGQPSAMLT